MKWHPADEITDYHNGTLVTVTLFKGIEYFIATEAVVDHGEFKVYDDGLRAMIDSGELKPKKFITIDLTEI